MGWFFKEGREPQERERIHTVSFEDPEVILKAARVFRQNGFTPVDAHTPFAVHGMEEAIGLPVTRLSFITLIGGILGSSIGFGFMVWTHSIDWPLNIGGKSNVAWEALVPIAFETTVLLAGFATFFGLIILGKLRPSLTGRTPNTQPHPRVTDDRFVLLIAERDGSFVHDEFAKLCEDLGAIEVVKDWQVSE